MTLKSRASETAAVEKYTRHGFDEIASLGPGKVAFYGGSFDPPHLGHSSLIEAALRKHVDYVVISVHSWNPAKQGTLTDLKIRLMLVAAAMDSMYYADRIFLVDPNFLNGMQNEAFAQLARDLAGKGLQVSVLIGADAVRDSYPVFMRAMDHILGPRNGGYGKARDILTGPVHAIAQKEIDDAFDRIGTLELYVNNLSKKWKSWKGRKEELEYLCGSFRKLGYDLTLEKLSHGIERRVQGKSSWTT